MVIPTEEPVSPEQNKVLSHDHVADPGGVQVATSLPTALMQPNLIALSSNTEPHTLWALRERCLCKTVSSDQTISFDVSIFHTFG